MRIFEKKKKGSILIFTFALCMMALLVSTQNSLAEISGDGDLFALGNEAYVNKDYNQAIVHYQAALESEGYAPSLLYNLGNAYYMNREIGQAILNYERALYLDPDNADIKANLSLARKNFGLATSDQGAWKAFFNHLNLNGWTWIAVMALCTFSLMVLINGVRPGLFKRPAPKLLVCLCLLSFMAAGAGMAAQYENLSLGVITADNARLRVSPFDSATDSGVVKNGKMVNLTDTYKGYVFVKTENGKSGWLPKKAVSEVLPTDETHQPQSSLTSSEIGKMNGSGGESKLKKT